MLISIDEQDNRPIYLQIIIQVKEQIQNGELRPGDELPSVRELAESLGLVTRFEWYEAWGAIMAGAGLLLLAEVAIRLLVPTYRRPIGGKLILAAVFLGIGLGDLFGWEIFLPLVIIAVGAGMLLRGLFRR